MNCRDKIKVYGANRIFTGILLSSGENECVYQKQGKISVQNNAWNLICISENISVIHLLN